MLKTHYLKIILLAAGLLTTLPLQVLADNTTSIFMENASDTLDIVLVKSTPSVYVEPFTATKLELLESRLKNIKLCHGYAHHSAELALAINLALNSDAFIRRQNYRVAESVRQAPYTSLATLAIFPEIIVMAERMRLEAIKRASDKLAVNVYGDEKLTDSVLAALRHDFGFIERICKDMAEVVRYNAINDEDWRLVDSECFISDSPADFVKRANRELMREVSFLNGRLEALLMQHEHHREFCEARLDFIEKPMGRMSHVKQAVQLSQLQKSVWDFLGVFENYQLLCSVAVQRLKELEHSRREGLDALIDDFVLKRVQVEGYLYKFPDKYKVKDVRRQSLDLQSLVAGMFATLKALRASELQKEPMQSAEELEAELVAANTRADTLLTEISPYVSNAAWQILDEIPDSILDCDDEEDEPEPEEPSEDTTEPVEDTAVPVEPSEDTTEPADTAEPVEDSPEPTDTAVPSEPADTAEPAAEPADTAVSSESALAPALVPVCLYGLLVVGCL